MIEQHSDEEEKERLRIEAKVLVKCPKCSAQVRRSRLDSHILRVHKIANSESEMSFSIGKSSPNHKLTKEDAAELRRAIQESGKIKNKEIAEYLRRNPVSEEMGKFGVPQDKYRYGFYGQRTMEYDVWRKGEKE